MKISFPFKTKITVDGDFCRIFRFEDYIQVVLKAGETYIKKYHRSFQTVISYCVAL